MNNYCVPTRQCSAKEELIEQQTEVAEKFGARTVDVEHECLVVGNESTNLGGVKKRGVCFSVMKYPGGEFWDGMGEETDSK